MTQTTTKVTLWTSLLVLTVTLTLGVFFEDGYDHHYTYTSKSDILGLHNVTTIIKVLYELIIYLFRTCRNWFILYSHRPTSFKGDISSRLISVLRAVLVFVFLLAIKLSSP